MSARLVPHTPRPSKVKPILERIQQTVYEQSTAPNATVDRLHRNLSLAREYLDLKIDASAVTRLDDEQPDGMFGLLDLIAGAITDVGAIEDALTNISNDAYRLLHPENSDTVDMLFPTDDDDEVKGTIQ